MASTPLIPGSSRSSRRTSGCRRAARSSASSALPPAPTTSKSGSSASTETSPSRTMGWSSTTRMRITRNCTPPPSPPPSVTPPPRFTAPSPPPPPLRERGAFPCSAGRGHAPCTPRGLRMVRRAGSGARLPPPPCPPGPPWRPRPPPPTPGGPGPPPPPGASAHPPADPRGGQSDRAPRPPPEHGPPATPSGGCTRSPERGGAAPAPERESSGDAGGGRRESAALAQKITLPLQQHGGRRDDAHTGHRNHRTNRGQPGAQLTTQGHQVRGAGLAPRPTGGEAARTGTRPAGGNPHRRGRRPARRSRDGRHLPPGRGLPGGGPFSTQEYFEINVRGTFLILEAAGPGRAAPGGLRQHRRPLRQVHPGRDDGPHHRRDASPPAGLVRPLQVPGGGAGLGLLAHLPPPRGHAALLPRGGRGRDRRVPPVLRGQAGQRAGAGGAAARG